MQFQFLAARLALAALVLAAIMGAGAVAVVRLGLAPYDTGITMMVPACAFGGIALLLALIWLYQALKHNLGAGKRAGLAALVGSLLFLYPPLSTLYYGLTLPPIHDATTDPDAPPQFVALAKLRRPGMNGPVFDGQQKIRYKGEEQTVSYALHEFKNGELTRPRARFLPNSSDPMKTMFWRAFQTAKQLGWTIIAYDDKTGRIEATAASPWFGRVSDIVVVAKAAGAGARVAVRAESREGAKDNGFNIQLLRAFLNALP